MRVWPGSPRPLGATWDGEGVNFAIFSENATAVQLLLFDDADGGTPSATVSLQEVTDRVWHAYLPDVRPGDLYGYKIDGPYEPSSGHRFNNRKLLLDPYAKAVSGPIDWDDDLFGYTVGHADEDLSLDPRDSSAKMPKSVVVDPAFTWGDDRPPMTPWNRTVIYEAHVRGMTMQHQGIPPQLRGTYLGIASDPVVDHLLGLGVTAIELMPVHHYVSDRSLEEKGLTNYWGYNSIAFFAPHVGYATGGRGKQVYEFKSMVRTLHRAGIEVILDVVYNHTGEGNQLGPTLSFRGIDNAVYYRLSSEDPRYYADYTGTGNTFNVLHPRAMGLITDSLRYWVTEMHVDGFRFDLAPVLARGDEDMSESTFFEIVSQDPVLSTVKLIAEPWDASPEGYRLGQFPSGWSEWNGAYRDCVRRFWRGDPGVVPELASRLAGSSDIYAPSGRQTYASVNFVTCHDGFTLTDLVSYEHKRNEANGEDNRDGSDTNFSRNWGVEGETDSARIQRSRDRMKRNFLATLMLSQGVPMLLGGDEVGRTQAGNNNAYCQDNPISWFNWDIGESGVRALPLRAPRHRGDAEQSDPPPPSLLHRRGICRRGHEGRHVGPRGRPGDDGAGLVRPGPAQHRDAPARSGHRRDRYAGPVLCRRFASDPAQCRHPLALVHAAQHGAGRPVGGGAQHGAARTMGSCHPERGGVAHGALDASVAAPRTSLAVSGPTLGSTYRLQLHGLGLAGAAALVPYSRRSRDRDALPFADSGGCSRQHARI